jgi:hypothetical protein
MKNVHIFDGKLPALDINKYTASQKNKLFQTYAQQHPECKCTVDLIKSQMETDRDIDKLNHNYISSDMLALAIKYVGKEELKEQLLDIKKRGNCIQGQVIRLFQLLYAHGIIS